MIRIPPNVLGLNQSQLFMLKDNEFVCDIHIMWKQKRFADNLDPFLKK